MNSYCAWYIDAKGDHSAFEGLTRGRAIWRYNWCTRNAAHLNLKEWGWRKEN